MTRTPLHAPLAGPAVLARDSATGGVAGLAALAAAGCALSGVLLAVGPAAQPARTPDAVALVAVTSDDHEPTDPLPVRPGQAADAAPPLTGSATDVPLGAPVPIWAAEGSGAGTGDGPDPSPVSVDPAVERALSRLRTAAADSRDGTRPGAAALAALDHALDQVGDPYVWGATGPAAYDCSGLTWRSYRAAGLGLPRVSRDQFATGGEPVEVDDLLPGDLVFFATAAWDPGVVHHVGMYVGGGLMVDAPRTGLTVRVEPMYAQGYVGAVRPVPARHGGPQEHPPERPADSGSPSTPTARPTPSPTGIGPTAPPEPPPAPGPPSPGTPTTGPPTPTATSSPTTVPTVPTTPTPIPTSTAVAPTRLPLGSVELVSTPLVLLIGTNP